MNQGQEMFYKFFMDRVVEDKQEEAKLILEESFKKQTEGTFDLNYLNQIMSKLLSITKDEAKEEVKEAMNHFSSNLKK